MRAIYDSQGRRRYPHRGHYYIYVEGKRIMEHRYTMEQFLGRKLLSNELVHHVNHDPSDNRIENLQIVSKSEHSIIHATGKKRTKQAIKKCSDGTKKAWSKNRKQHVNNIRKSWTPERKLAWIEYLKSHPINPITAQRLRDKQVSPLVLVSH
jgi:hypothetical protein